MAGKDAATVVLDSTHSRAICDEIGARLRDVLGRDASEIPSYLSRLVDRLAELERVPAPSIVPSINAMNTGDAGDSDTPSPSRPDSNFKQPREKRPLDRHCEPTGRANARPMTGSAKQSIEQQGRKLDCFAALAMTAICGFAISKSRLRDLKSRLRDLKVAASRSRRAFRARFAVNVPPSPVRGRRECRAPGAPAAACVVVENTRVSHHGHTGKHPAFPAQWF